MTLQRKPLERRKQRGISRALAAKPVEAVETQLGLLLLIKKYGRATVDDLDDADRRNTKFAHKGYRGAAVSGLRCRKVITCCGRKKSRRKFRHYGEVRVWKARRPQALAAAIRSLRAELKALRANGGAE